MKKIVFLSLIFCSLSFAFRLGTYELTPEFGAGAQQFNQAGDKRYYWSAFARLWIGAENFVLAPSMRYVQMNNSYKDFVNTQYGLSLGYTLDLIAFYTTPYIGASYSYFSDYYDDTVGFNAGLRLKPIIMPVSLGLEYEWQKPKNRFGNKQTIDGIRFSVGISF